MNKRAFLVPVLALSAAVLYLGCSSPVGMQGGARTKAADDVLATRALMQAGLEIQQAVDPARIGLRGSGLGNEATTVSIKVTGFGGTVTTAVPLDVVFAIDSSGSMGIPGQPGSGSDPGGLRLAAAKDFVDRLNPAVDRAAVVSWDEGINFTFPDTAPYPYPYSYAPFIVPPGPDLPASDTLSSDFTSLKNSIDLVDSQGNTNLAMGLQQCIRMLDAAARPESVDVIIFLTDGKSTVSWPPSILPDWISYAQSQGYRVYTIGLGGSVDTQQLQNMAAQTGGQYYEAPTAENLQALYDLIFTEVVSSTAPSAVDVVQVLQPYIVEPENFSRAPDSIVTDPLSGETTIAWLNVARYVGNYDERLASDETFSLSFKAKSSSSGNDLPVSSAVAAVRYLDPTGTAQSQPIPQALLTVVATLRVSIDIKPGSDSNPINPKAENGVIPVAILSTAEFDALNVDHTTVVFEGARETHVDAKTGLARRHEEDVDLDGDINLVFHFRLEQTALQPGSVQGTLCGRTYGGIAIEGSDAVRLLR